MLRILFSLVLIFVFSQASLAQQEETKEKMQEQSIEKRIEQALKAVELDSAQLQKLMKELDFGSMDIFSDSIMISQGFNEDMFQSLNEMFKDIDPKLMEDLMDQSIKMFENLDMSELNKMLEGIDMSEINKMLEGIDMNELNQMLEGLDLDLKSLEELLAPQAEPKKEEDPKKKSQKKI